LDGDEVEEDGDGEDALYFLQGPLRRIVPKSPAKVNSADFFTFNLMLIPASNVAFAVPAKSFFNGGNSIPPFGNEFVVILPLAANYLSLESLFLLNNTPLPNQHIS
jgi:hypothetical protein